MRVLILSAILACAAAAPSVPVLAIAPIIPAAVPTLSPGDLQAAAINAKVQAEDQARAIAEQARLAAEQARLAAEVAREQAELAALEGQKPLAYASVPALAPAPATPGDQQAAAIDAKIQAEDQARALADQARLAADAARDQAKLGLEGQKIVSYAAPSAPVLAVGLAPATPGDLQAAAIDAKVQAEDQARELAEQARLAAEQARLATEEAREKAELALQEKTAEAANEKNEQLFWNVEDKKWQAIDAVKTVEAKLDGVIASNADAIAKTLTYPVVSPIIPYPNLVYPGLVPLVKDEKLVKTGDKIEGSEGKPEASKLEGPKLGVLAPSIGLVGAAWGPIGAPVVYQPGLLGAPVLTPVIKQW